jgi:hypothetical protein
MVNIFSWGIGGEAMRNNFFRQATENPEALAAYGKFLRRQTLVESAATGFSAERFQSKMRRIQKDLPAWVLKSGKQAQVMPLTVKLGVLMKDRKWQEADKLADQLLAMMPPAANEDDEAHRHLLHALGGPFIVFRPKVQEALGLSGEQKRKLLETLPGYLPETAKVLAKLRELPPAEREKEMQAHRVKSHEKFAASLKEVLKPAQHMRFHQLELQHDGPSALGRPEIRKELNITDEQLRQFVGVIEEMQKTIAPLLKEAQSGGNQQEIRTKVIKIRKEHEEKLQAILSDEQRKQWKEMLGKSVDVLDD